MGLGLAVAATGCGSSSKTPSAAPTTSSVPSSTTSTVPVTVAPTSTTVAPTTTSTTSTTSVPSTTTTTAPPVPTLGHPAGIFAQGSVGFGQVRPEEVFNGGDPTGLVDHITWSSWGGTQATGTGTSDYVGPNQSVAGGTEEPATIVAFDLGTCDGQYMYQAVEWYFPQHGQSFSATTYEDVCNGSYAGQ